jgi:hypothetical protein
MRILQSIAAFAGLARSKFIELPFRKSSFNLTPELNTIHFTANYDATNNAEAATRSKYMKKGQSIQLSPRHD